MSAPYGVIWAIVDGLSDVGVARYNSLTPMQVARMPVMDRLTSAAVTGQHDPVRPGLACGSDAAHLQMFGYDSRAVYRGRGAFETIGAGLPMETGDVAFKCNFATMDPDGSGVVVKRCAGHDFHEAARALCADLDGLPLPSFPDVKVKVRHAGGHRLVASLSGEGISDKISNTDPLSDGLPLGVIEATAATAAARQTAEIANEMSAEFRRVLETHPVNARRRAEGKSVTDVVLLRGAAEQIELVPFEKATGLKAFLIAPTKIIAGIGSTAGMHIVKAPGATAGYDSDLGSKFSTCLTEMNRKAAAGSREYLYEMGIVHIKAVDEAVRPTQPILESEQAFCC